MNHHIEGRVRRPARPESARACCGQPPSSFLLAAAGVLYPVIFVAFMLAERPGLGIGHFYYFPVAMVALASGALWGAAAGS